MNRTTRLVLLLVIVAVVAASWFVMANKDKAKREKLVDDVKDLQTQVLTLPEGGDLQSAKAQYELLVGLSSGGIVLTDIEGTIIHANKAYQAMLGYSLPELKTLTYQQVTPKKWHELEAQIVADAGQKKYVRFKKEYIRKDGSVFPIDLTGWMIKDKNGKEIGTGSIVIELK
ncbi:MAG: PAS domain S-box protein [Candidatus Margulisiibacteriota bacterium]